MAYKKREQALSKDFQRGKAKANGV